MVKTPQAGINEVLGTINRLIFSASPTYADKKSRTNVFLALTPLSDSMIYVSALISSEDIFELSTENIHRTATITLPKDCSFNSLVQKLRAEVNPTFQHTFGSSVQMEFTI